MNKKIKMSTYNKLTCLFGFHDYSDKETRDKTGSLVQLCKICGKNGCRKWSDGTKSRYRYDAEGNLVYSNWSVGGEAWWEYDAEGNMIHIKCSDGEERWYDKKGNIIRTKPKNLKRKYEEKYPQ